MVARTVALAMSSPSMLPQRAARTWALQPSESITAATTLVTS